MISASLFDNRRYLTNFDSKRAGNIFTDVLVIGTGIGGARAALAAAEHCQVTLLSKGEFEDSCTFYAQGGIAAAFAADDSPLRHLRDTLRVGCGLNDRPAVELLVSQGPRRIQELVEWGLGLDRDGNVLALTREGGHSTSRIVHAQGDQTGREVARTLKHRVGQTANIRVFEHCFLIDFITLDGVCHGAVAYHRRHGHQLIWAKQTILASGGCGQLWRETTNPAVATGDGIAAAYRAGAAARDMELMQFHPTTLYVAGASRALISEAVRGEGGHLVDTAGRRFMHDYHPDGELAPRDIVSRAIHTHLRETHGNCVFLDVRHLEGFAIRFPHIARLCADFEIDVTRDRIPVRPSAHYLIGGVVVNLPGETGVAGLFCCGEAASTGVHGANRLASNSLLEGLVFGANVGELAGTRANGSNEATTVRRASNCTEHSPRTALDLPDIRNSLRSVMWRNVGIVRSGDRLVETCDILRFWGHYTLDKTFDEILGWETQNQLTVARLVAMSALERTQSLGVHFRSDAPKATADPYHVVIARARDGSTPKRIPLPPQEPSEPGGGK